MNYSYEENQTDESLKKVLDVTNDNDPYCNYIEDNTELIHQMDNQISEIRNWREEQKNSLNSRLENNKDRYEDDLQVILRVYLGIIYRMEYESQIINKKIQYYFNQEFLKNEEEREQEFKAYIQKLNEYQRIQKENLGKILSESLSPEQFQQLKYQIHNADSSHNPFGEISMAFLDEINGIDSLVQEVLISENAKINKNKIMKDMNIDQDFLSKKQSNLDSINDGVQDWESQLENLLQGIENCNKKDKSMQSKYGETEKVLKQKENQNTIKEEQEMTESKQFQHELEELDKEFQDIESMLGESQKIKENQDKY